MAQVATGNQVEEASTGLSRESRIDRWLSRAAFILSLTKSAADAADFAPLKGTCEAVVTLLESIQAVRSNESAWSELLQTIRMHTAAFQQQLDQLGVNDVLEECEESIRGPIMNYFAALKELVADICKNAGVEESEFDKHLTLQMLAQRIGTTKLDANIIASYEKRLRDAECQITRSLILYVTVSVNASADAQILNKLQCEEFTRPRECQGGTRMEILAQCEAWAHQPNAPNILWIKAAPGAGKSTIASSLVRVLGIKTQRLGSSFFFRRSNSSVTTTRALWRSVAYDLARHPTIRKHLAGKLARDQIDLMTPNVHELFHQLIKEPLLRVGTFPEERSPIIIIDALDECGGLDGAYSEDRQDLMRTLALWPQLPHYKLIVTSREEDDIARMFTLNPPYQIDLLVGEETKDRSKRDIQAFLGEELGKIAASYPRAAIGWPGTKNLDILATKADGLFIWASTAIEYIRRGPPGERLEEIATGKHVSGMSSLYKKVLCTAFPDVESDRKKEIGMLLATIIVARETLDLHLLAELLAVDIWTVEHICNRLRPVLETEGGIRFRHESFVDYLLDPDMASNVNYLISLAADMCRFTTHFNEVIAQSAPHIYISALPLSPPSSLVRKQYGSQYPNTLLVTAGGFQMWSPLLFTLRGHRAIVETVAFSSDGLVIISGSRDGTLRLWNSETGRQIGLPFEGHTDQVNSVAFSPDSRHIVSCSNDKTVRLWDVETGDQVLPPLEGHTSWVNSVAFSPDACHVASGSHDCTVRLWNAEEGRQIGEPFAGHTGAVRSVAFSPNGLQILSGSEDCTMRLWDVDTGVQIGPVFRGHKAWIRSVAFSPDGSYIASGSHAGTVRLWDPKTSSQIGNPFEGHISYINSGSFSPDGRTIVSSSRDNTIRLWDTKTGEQLGRSLEGHTDQVSSAIFAPDCRHIVSASWDKTLRLWNVEMDRQITTPLEGHTDWVNTVAFSPDSRSIVSGSNDETMRLWDVETGRQIGPPRKHTYWVCSIIFSPDGRHIASGSEDWVVRLFSAAPLHFIGWSSHHFWRT
ncbi:related to WD40-repeat protein (notchless protein) [Serendipita indica DSM 11827]|uniref:Related to WD40-repeat protein (Notchless protein) n=1 Tax=Serendipita indica (strain DSM 11827) TaxID=1109443 RepID=G4TY56_SERID|nr:related to WD40-repeat protein (notchless protein) [Serendipita indica DSM 11827]